MQDITKYDATYADLEAVPDHLVAELINGRLVTHPRPIGRHSKVHTRLIGIFEPPFGEGVGGPGGWEFLTEPELHLGGNVAVPEIAGWRLERIPAEPAADPLDVAKIRLAPDWVCEVLSKRTEGYDRGEKKDIYGRAGVRHLWLVDPAKKHLEVYQLDDGNWVHLLTVAGDQTVHAPPFEVMELSLARIWRRLRRMP